MFGLYSKPQRFQVENFYADFEISHKHDSEIAKRTWFTDEPMYWMRMTLAYYLVETNMTEIKLDTPQLVYAFLKELPDELVAAMYVFFSERVVYG